MAYFSSSLVLVTLAWTDFKNRVGNSSLVSMINWDIDKIQNAYQIFVVDNGVALLSNIWLGKVPLGSSYTQTQNDLDKADFEANYKNITNTQFSEPLRDRRTAGVLANLGDMLSISSEGSGVIGLQISGSWTGTIAFESSIDGYNWFNLAAFPPAAAPLQTSTTANGVWKINGSGLYRIRARASAWVTGTANISYDVGSGSTLVAAVQGAPAPFTSAWPVKLIDGYGNQLSSTLGSLNTLNLDAAGSGIITQTDAVVAAPAGTGLLLSGASTPGSLVALATPNGDSSWIVQLTGNLGTAVYYFEGSIDSSNGTDGYWTAINGRQTGITNTVLNYYSTTSGFFRGNTAGLNWVRVRAVGGTAGAATVKIKVSYGTGATFLNASLPAGLNTIGLVKNLDGYGNTLTGLTSAPTGAELGLVTRNIPAGTQTVAGTVAATESGIWSVRVQDGYGNTLSGLSSAPGGTELALAVRNIPSGTQVVSGSGSFTVAQPTGINLHAVIDSGAVAATQSGNWSTRTQDGYGNPTSLVSGRLDINNGAWLGSTAPTVGQKTMASSLPVAISSDQSAIQVTMVSASASTGICAGTILLGGGSIGTLNAIRATTYTEQTTNAQRSVSSSSLSDASAGIGARTVKITYYDATGAGPNTETVTLNGLTAVNTVNTNICFIEKMEVQTVGTSLRNVGTLSLFASTAGLGGTIGSIGVGNLISGQGDGKTLWAHHYIASGKTASFATFIVSATSGGTAVGGTFFLRSVPIPVGVNAETNASDILVVSGSLVRQLAIPIKVTGPSRIVAYGIPTSNSTLLNASFDFSEV